ncbi:leucine zipper domain-containing protein [Janibacter hoylei]
MSHGNARLNQRGRQLLVERVCAQGWAVAHAAKAQGVSREAFGR